MNKAILFILWIIFIAIAILSFMMFGLGGIIVYLLIIGGGIFIFFK